MAMKKDITIYDIAKEAGVSTATVSRVLAGNPRVRQDKKMRVQHLVDKYNFTPSAIARGLSETHSKLIGMLCPDVRNAYYANIFIECERQAYEKNYTLVLNNTFTQESLEIAFMEKLGEQRVESLIICGGLADWRPMPRNYLNALEQFSQKTPVVIAGKMELENCCQVYIDHEEAMRTVVRHLAALGHKRIAFLHGYSFIYQTQEKLAIFKTTMRELGLPLRQEYLVDAGEFNEQGGLAGMKRLLSLAQPPTAVIATNDLMAAGALQAILRLGYAVPGDFSLIGFDDSLITDLTEPNISSVHYDYELYATMLIETALCMIAGEPCARERVIPISLSVKDSCRKVDA